jgi:tRNA pseudouridine38-40 synthase
VVTGVRRAAPGFSARFDAEVREYRYRFVPGPMPPLFLSRFAWWTRHTLDLSAMRTAARSLIGEHDFRSFCVTESAEGRSTSRSLELVEILPEEHLGEHCVTVRIVGNAFLHSMVRVIAGSLVEIGLGRRDPEWLGEVLAACDRAAAGPTAPAWGLTLWHVSYPDECWL